jgi:neutral ceramidase
MQHRLSKTESPKMPDELLHVAYEEANITPPLGGSMPGYFADRKATGILDPLWSKVVYLSQAQESVALVACDLIGMAADIVARVRKEVAARCKSPPRHVWVHCTHSHSGGMLPHAFTSDADKIYPDFYPGHVDEQWVQQMVERTAAAVARAAERARGAVEKRLTLHVGREATVAFCRRYVMRDGSVRTNPGRNNPQVVRPAGIIDPRVHVLNFSTEHILIVLYGLHPDTGAGSHYSADFPCHLTRVLRHALGDQWRVLFLNTCCGNVNHINVNDPQQRSGAPEARRIGETLALAVLEALKKGETVKEPRLVARLREVACRLRRPPAEDVKQSEQLLRNYQKTGANPFGFNELYAPAALILDRTRDREHRAEIGALRLGPFGLAAMPGEIFVELGEEVEKASPFRPTRTIGLTNGAMGYIPTRRAYAEGGYEAGYRSARYVEDTGHFWARTAAEILQALGK